MSEIKYPKAITDPEWKKVEKKAGVSATGVGETLRNLEKAVKEANTELKGTKDPKKLAPLYQKLKTASNAARTKLISAIQGAGSKKNTAGVKVLQTYFGTFHSFDHSIGRLDAATRFGIDENVKEVNDGMN